MSYCAVLFDLDGVIVSTDECHYKAWKRLADEEGIFFSREINQRLRGVSRMQSLAIVLEQSRKPYSDEEKAEMAQRKNGYYRKLLDGLTPEDILPGVLPLLAELKRLGVKTAVASSSRNTPFILRKIGMEHSFDAVADGNEITKSKPDPEVFLLAARKLGAPPRDCVVVEDAQAGLEAARACGMKAVGVGSACHSPIAGLAAADLSELDAARLLA